MCCKRWYHYILPFNPISYSYTQVHAKFQVNSYSEWTFWLIWVMCVRYSDSSMDNKLEDVFDFTYYLTIWRLSSWWVLRLLTLEQMHSHVTHTVVDFLNACGIKTELLPPYSSNLAPCDFWIFPKSIFCSGIGNSTAIKRLSKLWKRSTKSSIKIDWRSCKKWQEQ